MGHHFLSNVYTAPQKLSTPIVYIISGINPALYDMLSPSMTRHITDTINKVIAPNFSVMRSPF